MKITFTSGSPNSFDHFDYFNILHPSDGGDALNIETNEITGGNGYDSSGQGIYGYSGISGQEAGRYAGSNGFIYVCSVEANDFANNIPASKIDFDLWDELIQQTRRNIHKVHGFDHESIITESHQVDVENTESVEAFLEKHEEWLSDIDISDVIEYPDDFEETLRNTLDMASPSSKMDEELCYFNLQDQINHSSVWELHITLGHLFSEGTGKGSIYYNKAYYEAFREVVGDDPNFVLGISKSAHEDDKDIIICFDVDKISIDKKIDLSKRKENTNEITPKTP